MKILVKEFHANAIVEEDELKCWVRKKSFSVSPAYLAEILHINRPIFRHSPVYDDLCPDKELLKESLGQDLEFSPNGNSISVSSLPPKLSAYNCNVSQFVPFIKHWVYEPRTCFVSL